MLPVAYTFLSSSNPTRRFLPEMPDIYGSSAGSTVWIISCKTAL